MSGGQVDEARRILDESYRLPDPPTREELLADRAKLRAVVEMLLARVDNADAEVMNWYWAPPIGPKP
jgi:hypothetical protein